MGSVQWTDKRGRKHFEVFDTEDDGKKIKQDLRAQGVKDMEFEW